MTNPGVRANVEKQNLQAIFDTRKKIEKEKYRPIAELKRAYFTLDYVLQGRDRTNIFPP